MKTLKQLRALKAVKCERIFTGKYHADNHEQFMEDILREAKIRWPNDRIDLEKKDLRLKLIINNKVSQYYWWLPKMKQKIVGEIQFRSKDYIFHCDGKESYGIELKKENLTDNGFEINTFQGDKLQYKILEGGE